ncbi:MAG: hypothetical protein VKQ33_05410 [Candidatus Sericytochromatia bacterium]|nr:hypothetical protein [Candidatus Sericytochromatia bacterium]
MDVTPGPLQPEAAGYQEAPIDYTVPDLVPPYAVQDSVVEDNRIGQLLLRSRILTVETLESCLVRQAAHPGRLLGEIVVELGHASVEDIHAALRAQLADLRLGQILVRTRCITPAQLDIALVEQENTGELLGSILIGYGFCTPEMIGWAIDQQNKD